MELLPKDVRDIVYKYLFASDYKKVVDQFNSFFSVEGTLGKSHGFYPYLKYKHPSLECSKCCRYIAIRWDYSYGLNMCSKDIKNHFRCGCTQ